MPIGTGSIALRLSLSGRQVANLGSVALALTLSGTGSVSNFTSAERALVSATSSNHYAKLELEDPDGNWKDVSTQLSTPDWLNAIQLSDSVDQNTMSFQASLLRDTGDTTLSLAPFREDSTLNRDSLSAYAPFLEPGRMWRVSVDVTSPGGSPSYKEIGKGYIDTVQVNDLNPAIDISGRGEEAIIIDHFVEVETDYANTGTPEPLEDVIQAALDAELGASSPTIYVPDALNYEVENLVLEQGSLMATISKWAAMCGAVIRYRYDEVHVNRLTVYKPRREVEEGDEDWSIAATEYSTIPLNQIDISGVRNRAVVQFVDADTGETVQVVINSTSTYSQTRYGIRTILIDLSEETQVTDAENATLLGEAVVSDLELPLLEQRFETFGFWFVRLQDYGKLVANGVHYDVDQFGGVTAFTHRIEDGHIRTTVDLGGQPRGGFRRWFPWGQKTTTMKPKIPTVIPIIPFIPGTEDGILVDLDPLPLLATLGSGDTTSYCPDVSGNGYHARQTSSGRYPTLRTDVSNGYPALEFGGEDHLITGDLVQPTTGTTVFVVLRRNGTFLTHGCFAGFGQAIASGGTTPADDAAIIEQYEGRLSFFDSFPTGNDLDAHYSIIGSPSTGMCLVTLDFQSTSSCVPYFNGVAGTAFNPTATIEGSNYARFFIGAGNGSGIWYGANCYIFRAKWYQGISTGTIASQNTYLMARYGVVA